MMEIVYNILLFLLALNLLLGFVRVLRGPELIDSMMASLLLGTGGTALLLAFFKITKEGYYINLALGFALLAGVVGFAFAIIVLRKSKDGA
ncbi:MAG: multiple resistance and pH regulation protein F [Aquificaceae bacterium]